MFMKNMLFFQSKNTWTALFLEHYDSKADIIFSIIDSTETLCTKYIPVQKISTPMRKKLFQINIYCDRFSFFFFFVVCSTDDNDLTTFT